MEREGTWRDRKRHGGPEPLIDFSDSMIFAMPQANVDGQISQRYHRNNRGNHVDQIQPDVAGNQKLRK